MFHKTVKTEGSLSWKEHFHTYFRNFSPIQKFSQKRTERTINKAQNAVQKALKQQHDTRKAEKQLEKAKQLKNQQKHLKARIKAQKAFKTAKTAPKIDTANLLKLGAQLKRKIQLFPENNQKERKVLIKKAMQDITEKQGDFNPGQITTLFDKAYDTINQETRQKIREDTQELIESDPEITESKQINHLKFYTLQK